MLARFLGAGALCGWCQLHLLRGLVGLIALSNRIKLLQGKVIGPMRAPGCLVKPLVYQLGRTGRLFSSSLLAVMVHRGQGPIVR